MTEPTRDTHTNSAGELESTPRQTDNGPKPGDGEVPDQDGVEIPSAGDPAHEGAGLAPAVLAKALAFKGTVEDPRGSNRQRFGADYGWNGVAWCNIYVSEVGRAVAGDYSLLGKFASTIACAKWWRGQGRFGTEPRSGAAVFFDWSGSKSIDAIDHIGLVIEPLASGLVRTIEGNAPISGRPDGVWVHDRNPGNIVGYGYPAYLKSAVPVAHGPGQRILREGDTGADVSALQRALGVGADGEFGPKTKAALMAFQKARGLTVDGEAGPKVWAAITAKPGGGQTAPAKAPVTPAATTTSTTPAAAATAAASAVPPFPGLLKRGSKGAGVSALQRRFVERGWKKMVVDGDFGAGTDAIVRAFQKEKGLGVDGQVGPKTWAALWTARVT